MLSKVSTLIGALALLIFTSGIAEAIRLDTNQGKLAVDPLTGTFRTAPPRANVQEGYRVYATPGSEGVIVYDNRCRQKVVPPRIYIVDPNRCRAGGKWLGAAAWGISAGVGLGIGLSQDGDGPGPVPAQAQAASP